MNWMDYGLYFLLAAWLIVAAFLARSISRDYRFGPFALAVSLGWPLILLLFAHDAVRDRWRRGPPNSAIAAIALVPLLIGCATAPLPPPEPVVRTIEVRVPVDDPECVREANQALGAEPVYPDTDAALIAADIFDQARLLMAGRKLRDATIAGQRAALLACS